MPHGKRRFSVTRKVALGLALIIAIGMVCMLIIYRGLERVGVALERVAAVQAPIVAAAYGMEVNVNGAMLHVLNYLASRWHEHRVEAEDDVQDFARYHATYLRLVATDRERVLARRIDEHYREFARLADDLMDLADRQEKLYAAISQDTEEIDYILDARLQPGLFREANLRRDGIGAAVASADLEAETAEVGTWVANYHRGPTPEARRTIMTKLAVMERTLDHFFSFNLSAEERRLAPALRRLVGRIAVQVREVVALEDEIFEGRNRLIGLREAMDDMLDDEIQILAVGGLDAPRAQAKTAADEVLVAMQLMVPMFLMAAGVIGFMLVQVIRSRLGKFYRGTLAVTGGDLSYRIPPASNDEFGDLARQYNAMVEQLEATTVSRDRLKHEMAERERAEQERESLQAELRRSETMSAMGALVAGVAHEVRNPLFAISSTLDALSARLGERTEYHALIENLRGPVNRLGKLMADLLAYGRPAAGEFNIGSVNSAVAPAIESCGSIAREAGVTVEVRLDPDLEPVRLDSSRLVQALGNLVDNALRHAPRGSRVIVETRGVEDRSRRWVECAVSDGGPGFEENDLPHVFEPFFTRRRGGTGLGLALVQRIVSEHGGEVAARNRPEGGAVVSMRLPVAQRAAP
ncbi:MAG: ATP-binding protein [Steroidobacteraceae bacterium]